MDFFENNIFLLRSAIIWTSLITAIFCYALLLELCFFAGRDGEWLRRVRYWTGSLRTMLAALPLLGLLGTISGLMKTFGRMSSGGGFALQEVISGGVAEAMFTTQLGLVLVLPGVLMLAYLGYLKAAMLVEAGQ